jgi:uncharacterized protein involved in tolerance to divalent cations
MQLGKEEGDIYWQKELIVSTTTASAEAARRLADTIVSSNLALSSDETLIKSFYWWDGAVVSSHELLLSFRTDTGLTSVCSVLEEVHDYEVPMIVAVDADAAESDEGLPRDFWKATMTQMPEEQALDLVSKRVFACIQVMPDGQMVGKTNLLGKQEFSDPKSDLTEIKLNWEPFDANPAYLAWVAGQVQGN